jgi:hypothetical protein
MRLRLHCWLVYLGASIVVASLFGIGSLVHWIAKKPFSLMFCQNRAIKFEVVSEKKCYKKQKTKNYEERGLNNQPTNRPTDVVFFCWGKNFDKSLRPMRLVFLLIAFIICCPLKRPNFTSSFETPKMNLFTSLKIKCVPKN